MKRVLLLAWTVLFIPSIIFAQQYTVDYSFEVGPKSGVYVAHESNGASIFLGAQGRMLLGRIFGLAGSIEYRGGQDYDIGTSTVKTKFIPVTVSGLIFVPLKQKFTPYLRAGLGSYYTIYDYENASSDNSFNFGTHLGVGADIPLAQNVKLNADYRYLFLDEDEVNLNGASLNGSIFTVGLIFGLQSR